MSTTDIADEDITLIEDAARKFVQTEVAPHLHAWEEAGELPRSLHRHRWQWYQPLRQCHGHGWQRQCFRCHSGIPVGWQRADHRRG